MASGRLFLAAVAFAPLAWRAGSRPRRWPGFLALGAVQFGLMYGLYIASFTYLPAWQVALFTVFTPVYVVLLADGRARRLDPRHWAAAALAVGGALLAVRFGQAEGFSWRGFFLLQGANLSFAVGQLLYPWLRRRERLADGPLMAWMYAGAFLVTALVVLLRGGPDGAGWGAAPLVTLLYLGLIPTAVGFYLWNRGAAEVAAGPLAVANNLKIPLAVVVSWLVFREDASWVRASLGLVLVVAGLFLVRRAPQR
ncbi:hypothetical protein CSA17_01615 [bacterium DOLJORAL78_65_58]|nr:MAG: hypothetical protein CSA17_01615 [bacterium DOLJORAL78_65_58]